MYNMYATDFEEGPVVVVVSLGQQQILNLQ
jgi:hypothetical protein